MNIAEAFPSKYVRAADLKGQVIPVQIGRLELEEVDSGKPSKPVVYFTGMSKGMVLNKTNATKIASLHGTETNNWVGKYVALYPTTVDYGGQQRDCIRIKNDVPAGAAPVAPPPPPPPVAAGGVTF